MARFQAKNQATINRAFARFRKEEEDIIREGMIRVAKAGMDYLIEAHETFQSGLHHPTEDDTMAYAVSHNGTIVASGSHNGDGDDIPGNARNKVISLLSDTKGWVAMILSDMEGWYRVDWEMDFLHSSIDEIREDFTKYFKQV